jgi:hypothetical protein
MQMAYGDKKLFYNFFWLIGPFHLFFRQSKNRCFLDSLKKFI